MKIQSNRRAIWLFLLLLTIWPIPLTAAESSPAEQQNSATTSEEENEPEGYSKIVITYPKDTHFQGWQLAHKIYANADENSARIKRPYWRDLANRLNQTPISSGNIYYGVMIGFGDNALPAKIRKVYGEENTIRATLLLPKELIKEDEGNFNIDIETDFQLERQATTQIMTWPVSVQLGYEKELNEKLTYEFSNDYTRTFIRQKECTPVDQTDSAGERAKRCRDAEPITISDSHAVNGETKMLLTLSRSKIGKLEGGTILTWDFERDLINMIKYRTSPQAGLEMRLSSESIDNLEFSLELTAGVTDETLLANEYDGAGNLTGNIIEDRNILPVWEATLGASAPLYRLYANNILLFNFEGSYKASFTKDGWGKDNRGTRQITEQDASGEGGLEFRTPFGIGMEIGSHVNWSRIPSPNEDIEEQRDLQFGVHTKLTIHLSY
jgi:hypothetical protein